MSRSKDRKQQVGIDRLIRLQWLEYTSNLVLAGNNVETIKIELEEVLAPYFPSSSANTRGSLSKTITVLLKTWARINKDIKELRNAGLELLRTANKTDHIAIHWGMIMAAYPFWGAVAEQTGRLFRLQENVAIDQIQRRLREQYGERETVFRRVRYVIRAYVDWQVMGETAEKGIYCHLDTKTIDDPRVISWLIEASRHARTNATAEIKDLLDGTSLFPFRFSDVSVESLVSTSPRLDFQRHGLKDNIVMLRK